MKNQISHLDNSERELTAKIKLMEKNRDFLIRISGFEDRTNVYDHFDSRGG